MPLRSIATAPAAAAAAPARVLPALFELTKPRLAAFSILSGMTGYSASSPAGGWAGAALCLTGTALAAGGALALNQWWERDTDRRMRRTADRPLPRGAITPAGALAWSLALGTGGVVLLARQAPAAAALAGATIVLYGLVYTPLKRVTRWATEIGAVSGALPPLIGAAAAGGLREAPAWILASVLLFWQMPHFYAIGWMHRADYRAAGFPLLPAVDGDGRQTAAWSLFYTGLMVAVSLAPWTLGLAGPVYGVVAAAGAVVMLRAAICFRCGEREASGRGLFRATLLYLPPVMAALVADRWTA